MAEAILSLQDASIYQENNRGSLQIKGIVGSSKSFAIANLFSEIGNSMLVIYDDPEEASYALNELENLFDKNTVLYFPASHRRPYEIEETNNANVVLRTEVMNKLSSSKKPRIIVSNSNAITEKVVTKATLSEHIYEEDADRDSNVIEVFIGRLRKKLDPDGALQPIETLRGRGYRLNVRGLKGA